MTLLFNFSDVGEYLFLIFFALGFIGIFALKGYDKDDPVNSRKFVKFGIICLTPIVVLTIFSVIAEFIMDINARKNLKEILKKKDLHVLLNDRVISNDSIQIYTNELKNVKRFINHHSVPRKGLRIDLINNKDTISLILRQDSDRKTEYWIMQNDTKTDDKEPFGFINTSIFRAEELILPQVR